MELGRHVACAQNDSIYAAHILESRGSRSIRMFVILNRSTVQELWTWTVIYLFKFSGHLWQTLEYLKVTKYLHLQMDQFELHNRSLVSLQNEHVRLLRCSIYFWYKQTPEGVIISGVLDKIHSRSILILHFLKTNSLRRRTIPGHEQFGFYRKANETCSWSHP